MKRGLFLVFTCFFLTGFFWFNMSQAQGVEVGDVAPKFKLKDISGDMISFKSFENAEGFIVVFTCNHCPYSKLYEDRLIALHNTYEPQGWPVVAINPNDVNQYPSDSYDNMIKRAEEKGFTFRYLYDESQEIAQEYGATRTPHVFLVKNSKKPTVEYIGAIDNNPKDATAVDHPYLEDAIDAVKNGQRPDPATTKAIGCSIKWKKS